MAWPNTEMAIFASALFIVAAITDFFDDYLGGNSRAATRKFGWADDAADTVLIIGTLGALAYVMYREGILLWPFAIPAAIKLASGIIDPAVFAAPQTLVWTVSAWAFLPASMIMRGIALMRIADLIIEKRRRASEDAEPLQSL